MFRNIQEQEQIDYEMGWASEQQNALAWSRMNRKPSDELKIAEAVAAGKFVWVEEGTEYCPITDAIMGSRKVLCGSYNTREAANAAMVASYGDEGPNMDIDCYILPREHVSMTIDYLTDDEIPF